MCTAISTYIFSRTNTHTRTNGSGHQRSHFDNNQNSRDQFGNVNMVLTATVFLITSLARHGLDPALNCVITTEDLRARMTPCRQLGADFSPVRLPSPSPAPTANWQVAIDASRPQQQMIGFGAAWTDAAVFVLRSLNQTTRSSVMADLFGGDALGLTIMRHTIGQSDLTPASIGRWSYDENEGKPDDDNLSHFNLTSPGEHMTSIMRDMLAINPDITVLGSVWSPPGWMKDGSNSLSADMYERWVRYFVHYLTDFRAQGVQVGGV